MRTGTARLIGLLIAAAAPAASAQPDRSAPTPGRNLLTRFLDFADIHPPVHIGRLSVFPITLARPAERLAPVLTMQQALGRGLLAVEELSPPRIDRARFVNRSRRQMIFLMDGELISGGKQNRALRTDALLAPASAAELPLYCVQKGRWEGKDAFDDAGAVAPQGIRGRAARQAGQDELWAEVARANRRLGAAPAGDDLYAALTSPAAARRLAALREKILPRLPRGCVGLVAAVGPGIVAADLFNNPDLFADMRRKVLDAYLAEHAWPLPVRDRPIPPRPEVTAEDVRRYLRGCYQGRFVPGETRGAGRIWYLRGSPSGRTLGYRGRVMVHTSLLSPRILPVRPPGPVPLPRPGPDRPGVR